MEHHTRCTALYHIHKELGARIVNFAGWRMPIWYNGINAEHAAVRKHVGIFDVSHMGQIEIKGVDAQQVVDYLVTNSVSKLQNGQALYTPACNAEGGIVDDLIVYKRSRTDFLLCVNAGTTQKDYDHFVKHNPGSATISNVSSQYSLIAVQGPESLKILQKINPQVAQSLYPFRFVQLNWHGYEVLISATGYTGEDGYELYVPWDSGPYFWNLFVEAGKPWNITPVGLGARDTLRLEAKYCLYGNDINDSTNPFEAGLGWTVDFSSDFLGKQALLDIKKQGLKRKLVGFEMLERGIPRPHNTIFVNSDKVGYVTSGNYAPYLKKNIGLGYVKKGSHKKGTQIYIQTRKKKRKAIIVKTPFYVKRITLMKRK